VPISSASVATRRLIPLRSGRDATAGTYGSGTTAARGSNRSGFDANVRLGFAATFAFGLGFAAERAAGARAAGRVAGARYTGGFGGGGGGGGATRGRATDRDGASGTGARSGFGVLGGGGGGGSATVSGGGGGGAGGGGASSANATPAPIPSTMQKQTVKATRALRREPFIARS
jgi:hypothetical protein